MIAVVIVISIIWRAIPEAPEGNIAGNAQARDGDSLVIGRRRIRLIGIDAPEQAQMCGTADATWACGREAEARLSRLAKAGPAQCAYFERDRYGRYLAQCKVGARDLGETMVREGWAIDLDGRYAAAEREARAARRGIWRGPFLRPAVWRRRNPRNPG